MKESEQIMDLETYQVLSRKTVVYGEHLEVIYPLIGLQGECGEVAELIKKQLRKDGHLLDLPEDKLEKLEARAEAKELKERQKLDEQPVGDMTTKEGQ